MIYRMGLKRISTKAKRPILHGNPAVYFYYVTYLLMFALGITFGAKAVIG
jgi:hypothetical protein